MAEKNEVGRKERKGKEKGVIGEGGKERGKK